MEKRRKIIAVAWNVYRDGARTPIHEKKASFE